MCQSADEDELSAEPRGFPRSLLYRKVAPMGTTKIDQITIVYRGETQPFKTVWLAVYVLRHPEIKVGWFHTIKATVDLMGDDKVRQTRHLKGDKHLIIRELEQLESDLESLPAKC